MLEMLTGDPCYRSNEMDDDIVKSILGGDKPEYPLKISRECRSFLDCIFKINPSERSLCDTLLLHDFIAQKGKTSEAGSPGKIQSKRTEFDKKMTIGNYFNDQKPGGKF
jgi:serine/threonine protein kinase